MGAGKNDGKEKLICYTISRGCNILGEIDMFRFVFRFLSLFCGGPPPESVVEVMDKHGDRILRVAYSYLHNMEDAEDILQDTLIKYMQSSPDFNGPEHEKAWLITVASNLSKNKIKYNKVREADELSEELVGREEQDLAFVWEAVKQLPVKYREVVHLFYQEGYSTGEISKILDRKEATVRSDLLRARTQLKNILKEAYDFE